MTEGQLSEDVRMVVAFCIFICAATISLGVDPSFTFRGALAKLFASCWAASLAFRPLRDTVITVSIVVGIFACAVAPNAAYPWPFIAMVAVVAIEMVCFRIFSSNHKRE